MSFSGHLLPWHAITGVQWRVPSLGQVYDHRKGRKVCPGYAGTSLVTVPKPFGWPPARRLVHQTCVVDFVKCGAHRLAVD